MTIQEMKDRKQELGYSLSDLSERSGVPLGTVMKIFGGATKSPRRETIEALEKVLAPAHAYRQQGRSRMIEEPAAVYNTAKKLHTIEEYYALPDDQRIELIDGVFYDMAAPTPLHQELVLEIASQIRACIRKQKSPCRIYISPCDVRLCEDNYNMVQPDIFVLCTGDKITEKRIEGAPDLTMEIMSPESRAHDAVTKLYKYRTAGVREYWLIDPEKERITLYDFGHGTTEFYDFTDIVPVHISGGACKVDFKEIAEAMHP